MWADRSVCLENSRQIGVPGKYLVWTLVPSSRTRWGTEFEQVSRNNLLRHAVDQSVEKFKRRHKGSVEAIVEENISDQGRKAGRAVPADEIGLNPQDWETNPELETFLSYPFEIKDTID